MIISPILQDASSVGDFAGLHDVKACLVRHSGEVLGAIGEREHLTGKKDFGSFSDVLLEFLGID